MPPPVRGISSYIPEKPTYYSDFQGIDRSRDKTALDTGEKQNMVVLNNCFADWRGRIIRDAKAHKHIGDSNANILTIRFYDREGVCWAQKDGGGVTLKSDRNHNYDEAFTKGSIVTMAKFGGEVHAMSPGQTMFRYNGLSFKKNPATTKPGFGIAIQNRFFVAGIPGKPMEVHASRAEEATIFLGEEPPDSTNVLRASFIGLKNMVDGNEEITGLGAFEVKRLAILTTDQCLIYTVDPDLTEWAIDDRANVRVGCISHRTIAALPSKMIFGSRYGVHTIGRSGVNGLTITEDILSNKVEPLYRELVQSVPDFREISAVYDHDERQYHMYFPHPSGVVVQRLTLNIREDLKYTAWSTGNFLNATCGDSHGGQLVLGTHGGPYAVLGRAGKTYGLDDSIEADEVPSAVIKTPILWHGDLTNSKASASLTIHATGIGSMSIIATDDKDKQLASWQVQVDTDGTGETRPDSVLVDQYQVPFTNRYRGVQFEIVCADDADITIIGIAVNLNKDA